MIGEMLSHYRIVEKLGAGGMGIVWKAVDTKLEREVAIKVLPEPLARDAEHLARFAREAKMLAALNHRNIAAIYGIDEAQGKWFLVMELVLGEDLACKLRRGPLPLEEALDVGHQLAGALEAAHEKGVLHRDLKPANVQITPEGRAKVLDFGLAKAFESEGDPAKSPTLTSGGTRVGTILGTAGYMSPEQARGKPLDKRSDIWSFGCVLYESLTGRAPFVGDNVADSLAAVLKTEPNWTLLPDRTPPRVRELLQRCLEKDVRNRLRDAGDARIELQRSISGRDSKSGELPVATTAAPRTRSFKAGSLALAALLGLGVGAGLWAALSRVAGFGAPAAVRRLSLSYPRDLLVNRVLLSPEGAAVAFVGSPRTSSDAARDVGRLYLRELDRFEAKPVEGSDGVRSFCFSPDGRWLAMLAPVAPRSTKLRLSKVPVDGSAPPLTLMEWRDEWTWPLLWLPDGDLLAQLVEPRSVLRIPADGGAPRPPVAIRNEGFEGQFFWAGTNAAILPDGVHLLGTASTYSQHGYDNSVAVLDVDTGQVRILVENGSLPAWPGTGHLLFSRSDALLAVPFDLGALAPAGGQVAVADGLRADAIWQDAEFQVAAAGTLLHWPGGVVGGSRRLALLDRSYSVAGSWSDDRRAFESALEVSRDGRWLAVVVVNAEGLYDIWVSEMEQPRLSMMVHEPGRDCQPRLWTPEGDRLVYSCSNSTESELYVGPGDGEGERRLLFRFKSESEFYAANDFLPDGSRLIGTHSAGGETDLVLLPFESTADGPPEATLLLAGAGWASVSPDGHWLVYTSDASGRNEIYLRGIGNGAALGPEIPVSRDGGQGAIWYSGEGAAPLEIHYFQRNRVEGVTVTTEPRVSISKPKPISGDLAELFPKMVGGMSPLPDGRSLVILAGDDEEPPTEASVVLNWFSELRERTRR